MIVVTNVLAINIYYVRSEGYRKVHIKYSRKLTLPVQSSAKMQPSDHISIFLSYGSPRITSGAL